MMAVAFGVSLLLTGCVVRQGAEKQKDLEFTVIRIQDVPASLKEQLQETGGYCISVNECYLAENKICVRTTLNGPQAGEKVEKTPSYPMVILKMELRSEPVVFE